MFSTPKPLSAHASVIPAGRTLSWCGARMQSATTPGTGRVAEGGGLAGGVAGGGMVTECGLAAVLALPAPHAAKARLDPNSEHIASAMREGRTISVLTLQSARRLAVSRPGGGTGEVIARRLTAKGAAVQPGRPDVGFLRDPQPTTSRRRSSNKHLAGCQGVS
jgi:hypothetical protein